jgi:3D (Asp-Asp-Asp) domain-containing protein
MITPISAITTTPLSVQITEMQIDNNNVVNKNKLEINKHPIFEKFEKDREEFLKMKQVEEERLKKEKELEEQKKQEPQWQEFILTYYSGLQCENSSNGSITCTGKKLQSYMVANNTYSLGTKIYLEGYGEKTVSDRGSNKYFSNSNRLDVYIEREPNESDSQYFNRVNKMGVKKVRGYVIK